MPSDSDQFIRTARNERGGFFDPGRPITLARAPAWVDLLGGAAAYGGSLALGWTLGSSAWVALQPDPQPSIHVRVAGTDYSLPLAALRDPSGAPHEYAAIAAQLDATAPAGVDWWAAALGSWAALMREEFVDFPGGARVLLQAPDLAPAHTAIAAALSQALVSAYGIRIAPRELGLVCMEGLRRVAGRPVTALGPLMSICGRAGDLTLLHQQPAWQWGDLHLPHGAAIWALRVGDGPPPPMPTIGPAAAAAYCIAADGAGLSADQADMRWGGYMANIGAARFGRRLRDLIPAQADGAALLDRYPALANYGVAAGQSYASRAVASLAVEEHLRSRTAAALLRAAASKAQREDDLLLIGELLAQSHWGQRAAGFGDAHADALVDLVDQAGPARGLYGARVPDPASGLSLVVIGRDEGEPALRTIAADYRAATGLEVSLSGGSAPGASPAGTREI